jgi:AmmeMemoRadiSam system protein A
MNLSASDKEQLLKLARQAIRAHLKGEAASPPANPSAVLCQPWGVFVSLHRQGNLRGCIGYLAAVKPLMAAVEEMAAAAAFHDPRFPPLREEELADLEVEISVLSPMERITRIEDIQVGRHGLFVERGPSRGLLLPQVATQWQWDRLTFLQQTCCKAGLPPDAWKDAETRISIFTAEIFADHGPPRSNAKPEFP